MATTDSSSSRSKELLVVLPSVHLDSHMQSCAAEAIKEEHLKSQSESSDDDYEDNPMTPPEVLLNREIKKAKRLVQEMNESSYLEVCVSPKEDLNDVEVLKSWIRANALARIVHGQHHWMLAKTHIQLGKTYLDAVGLHKQALLHANKGCDILCGPDGQLACSEGGEEPWFQLAMAHCVAGRAHIIQGSLGMAEKQLQDAERVLAKHCCVPSTAVPTESEPIACRAPASSSISNEDVAGLGPDVAGLGPDVAGLDPTGQGEQQTRFYLLEKEISAARARLDLKRGHFRSSSKNFSRSIDLTKSLLGLHCCQLIPLLRGRATAEANLAQFSAASQSLLEASIIVKELFGDESVAAAELLQAQGRLGSVQLNAGVTADLGAVEDTFVKALALFSSKLGSSHEKTLFCKEELVKILSAHPGTREKAIELLEDLIQEQKGSLGELSVEVGQSLKLLSSLFLQQGRLSEATFLLEEAKCVFTYSFGPKHKEIAAAERLLKSLTISPNSIIPRNHWKI